MARLTTPSFKTYQPITTRESLIEHLSWAQSLELSTVPPYLTAMYSLQDATSDAYQLVKGVVIEEMLHLTLACNLMVAVGGEPTFDKATVPEYPTYIPHHAAGGPFISLQALSVDVARNTFCAIEAPANQKVPPAEGDDYQTIGQFYQAILEGFEYLDGKLGAALYVDHGEKQLHQEQYFGGGGGRVFVVRDLASARRAIEEIVQQGEGHSPWGRTGGSEPYGGRFHYGIRPDGTYGPILGVGSEQSHYQRFVELVDGTAPIGATWPMQTNIRADQISDKTTRALAETFDRVWTLLLRYIGKSFTGPAGRALFFRGAVPLMHGVMPAMARALMQTPLDPRTGDLGPNAGPGFQLVDGEVSAASLADAITKLADTAVGKPLASLLPLLRQLPEL